MCVEAGQPFDAIQRHVALPGQLGERFVAQPAALVLQSRQFSKDFHSLILGTGERGARAARPGECGDLSRFGKRRAWTGCFTENGPVRGTVGVSTAMSDRNDDEGPSDVASRARPKAVTSHST